MEVHLNDDKTHSRPTASQGHFVKVKSPLCYVAIYLTNTWLVCTYILKIILNWFIYRELLLPLKVKFLELECCFGRSCTLVWQNVCQIKSSEFVFLFQNLSEANNFRIWTKNVLNIKKHLWNQYLNSKDLIFSGRSFLTKVSNQAIGLRS